METIWHNISDDRIKKDDFIAVIEISKGSKKKYEMDKETGLIIMDRVLYTSTQYPQNYGFIPKTYSDDGDPLDVLVMCSESIDPMSLVRCYPVGVITMIDSGKTDEKIVAIPFGDPLYNQYQDISALPKHVSDELIHFLNVYKNLEDKVVEIKALDGREKAEQAIVNAKLNYQKTFGGKNGK